MTTSAPKVDVALCVYGKPFQTAVTIASLLKESGQHIGRIFIQEEKYQPYGENVKYLRWCFPEADILQFVPRRYVEMFWLAEEPLSWDNDLRRSVRYQYAWESTDKDFLFVTHNDCLFSEDIIGKMLEAVADEYSGAGIVGQCWNCPFHSAGLCDGDKHESFNPSYDEAVALIRSNHSARMKPEQIDREQPMPVPECRLGEFACLINLKKTRDLVMPRGRVVPFGWFTHDTGVKWFREMRLLGHRFLHMAPGLKHAPFSPNGNGNSALQEKALYLASEQGAKEWLSQHYPDLCNRVEVYRNGALKVPPPTGLA